MQIIFLPQSKDDLNYWIKSGNKNILKKITELIKSIKENPYIGIGKPEQLKYELSGCWSRRINDKDRIVYEVDTNKIIIHSLKGHY